MATQLSPGVNVSEFDLTTIVPAVSTSAGAIAGIFAWGPVMQRILVSSEKQLVQMFGMPNANNYQTWFTAANFLGYGNTCWVVRAANTSSNVVNSNCAYNAIANASAAGNVVTCVVLNQPAFYSRTTAFDTNVQYVAKYPGGIGNSLQVSQCDTANAWSSNVVFSVNNNLTFTTGSNVAVMFTSGNVAGNTVANTLLQGIVNSVAIGDYLLVGNGSIGTQYIPVTGSTISSNSTNSTLTISLGNNYRMPYNYVANTQIQRYWQYFNVTGAPPVQTSYVSQFNSNSTVVDGMHVVVVDAGGLFTGTPGTVLETYIDVSRASDSNMVGGQTNYYQTVINQKSQYIWAVNDRSNAVSNTTLNIANSTNYVPMTVNFNSGGDGYTETSTDLGTIAFAYNLFQSKEDVVIDLLMQGKPIGGSTVSGGITVNNFLLAQYLIENIIQYRGDCVGFITPDDAVITQNSGNEAQSLVNWRNVIDSTSYAVMDSGYKYMYDKYNDVYRWVPTNGDIAGLCARTDMTNDAWWSPAGYNRGELNNVIQMRYNPKRTDRDLLYSNGINPVVTFPGQGTILFGDKTLQTKPSAFDRINVRRLFLVLERAIATASKYTLFEFNDAFTQLQFRNLINPYLRDVKGRRGITDFIVICDGTNNTPQVVDSNQFIGDIYIKPARSINFIQLNFIATATGVAFSTVVGTY
ncbi:MAG: phage tail sheath C-terminal domain-containing protein [Candidatus Bathyarchaeia archaeon]